MTSFTVADFDQFTPTHGIRAIETDPARMRLFFLSLLWRAAESDLPECAEVKLENDERRQLRQMLLDRNPDPPDFFPIMLTQSSTMGIVQNHGPIKQLKPIPAIGDFAPPPVWIYRFYLDGLVAHFHCQEDGHASAAELGDLVVGNGPRALVNTVTYARSWQHENLQAVMQESLLPR